MLSGCGEGFIDVINPLSMNIGDTSTLQIGIATVVALGLYGFFLDKEPVAKQ